jgi:hypothetical protein
MNDEFVNLKDQQVLYEIKDYLEKLSVAGTVLESSKEIEFNILLVIAADQAAINIMYVPAPEDQFEEIRLLQFHSMITANIAADMRSSIFNLLNELNNLTPLGSFSINAEDQLSYKYIFPVSRFDIPKESTIREMFTLYHSALTRFKPILLGLNEGKLTTMDAISQIREA